MELPFIVMRGRALLQDYYRGPTIVGVSLRDSLTSPHRGVTSTICGGGDSPHSRTPFKAPLTRAAQRTVSSPQRGNLKKAKQNPCRETTVNRSIVCGGKSTPAVIHVSVLACLPSSRQRDLHEQAPDRGALPNSCLLFPWRHPAVQSATIAMKSDRRRRNKSQQQPPLPSGGATDCHAEKRH